MPSDGLDPASLLVIAIIAVTLALMYFKRFGATQLLIIGNLAVFFVIILSPYGVVWNDLGLRPIYLQNGRNLYTLFTSMFLHADAAHIFFNVLYLFLIGVQLEERIGKGKYIVIFLLAGLVGGLLESVVRWDTTGIIIGASGAISGTMGALLLLYPRDRIPMIVVIIFLPSVPVWAAVGSWFGLQAVLALSDPLGPTAYAAHIGGFFVGMLLAHFVPSFKRTERPIALDVGQLEALATTPELKDALEKIRTESQPDIKKAWLEYFAAHARCPRCEKPLELHGNKLKCACGYESDLK